MALIGIDLGTSSSEAAVLRGGRPVIERCRGPIECVAGGAAIQPGVLSGLRTKPALANSI